MKKNKLIAIIIASVLSLSAIGVGTWALWPKKEQVPNNPPAETPVTPPVETPVTPPVETPVTPPTEGPEDPVDPPVVEPVTKYYYTGLTDAISAINSDSFENDQITEPTEQSGVEVFVDDEDVVNIALLKSFDLSETLQFEKDLNLILSGETLNFSSDLAMKIIDADVKIDGSESGSKIVVGDKSATAKLFEIQSGSLSINGGQYESSTSGSGTSSSPHPAIALTSGTIDFKNATISASDNNGGTIQGINIAEGCSANLTNTNVTVSSKSGLDVRGVDNLGTAIISNCSIKAYADYTGKNNNYATHSRGVFNSGTMTLKNCTVCGVHSGISSKGTLYIDGGSYSGHGHGGVYFAGPNTTSYIKNATLFDGEMPEGYIVDEIAGTNAAGMYIGGASNISVYMDNCELRGVKYAAVLRNSGGETGNNLYLSDCTLEHSSYIRTRTTSGALKVYLGVNNVVKTEGARAVDYEQATVNTDIDYGTLFPAF